MLSLHAAQPVESIAQKGCATAVSILNVSQVSKDDLTTMYQLARGESIKSVVEAAYPGVFLKLQKAQVPVHTQGELREGVCRENPTRGALVASPGGKSILFLCAPARLAAEVVDEFRAEAVRALQFNGKNSRAEALIEELLTVQTPAGPVVVGQAKNFKMPLEQARVLSSLLGQTLQQQEKMSRLEGPAYLESKVFAPSAAQGSPYRALSSLGTFSTKSSGEITWEPSFDRLGGKLNFEQSLGKEMLLIRCEENQTSQSQHVLCPFQKYKQQSCSSLQVLTCLDKFAAESLVEMEKRRKYSSENEELLKKQLAMSDSSSCAPTMEYCAENLVQRLRATSYYARFLRAAEANLKRECLLEAYRPSVFETAGQSGLDAALEPLDRIVKLYRDEGWDAFQKAVAETVDQRKLESAYGSYFSALGGFAGLSEKTCAAPKQAAACSALIQR